LTGIDDFLFNQLELLPGVLDGRSSLTAIIDSTLLRRFSDKVYSAKLRWNYAKGCYEILQEQINCCIFTNNGTYTVYEDKTSQRKKHRNLRRYNRSSL